MPIQRGLEKERVEQGQFNLKTKTFKGLPENHILQVKRVLYDARGGHPDPEDVLLGRHIARVSDPVQCVQIAGARGKKHSTYVAVANGLAV